MAKSTVSDDPVSEQDKFMLRLPKGMRERIKSNADLHGRSMNAEIVAILDEYPSLVTLPMRVSYLQMENDRLSEDLLSARLALKEQRENVLALRKLQQEQTEEIERDQETLSEIETRFSELKEQVAYLETLKANLLQLSQNLGRETKE